MMILYSINEFTILKLFTLNSQTKHYFELLLQQQRKKVNKIVF